MSLLTTLELINSDFSSLKGSNLGLYSVLRLYSTSYVAYQAQSTYIPRVPQCLSPRPNWDPPPPLPQESVSPPPRPTYLAITRTACQHEREGLNSDDWRKSPALCLLCDLVKKFTKKFEGTFCPIKFYINGT
jgi:hypothetical protein